MVVAIYLLSFPWHPLLRSPNELCRLMQTRALVDFGELSLNRAIRLYGPVGDLSIFEGRLYPSKAPLMSFAAVPVYAVLRALVGGRPGSVPEIPLVFFSRLFLTVLPTLLSLVLLHRLLATYVEEALAVAVTLTYALGTLAFSYSLLFMSHQTTATLLLAGFYVSWRVARGERSSRWLVLCGACLGLAVVAEYTSALPALAIGLYAAGSKGEPFPRRLRALALLVVGGLPMVGFLASYHQSCFGGVLETGYRHLADVQYQPWHAGGFLGIKTPTLTAFAGSFFSPLRGLLPLSPALLLGFAGLGRLWARRREHPELGAVAVFTGLLTAAYVYFTSSFSYASWGWTTGPRHLTGLIPFLMLPLALDVAAANTGIRRGVATGLMLSSVVVTSALTFVNYIPDDVSNGLFGLFVPLARAGNVVPSVLGFFGLANPLAGSLSIALALVAAGFVLTPALSAPRLPALAVVGATLTLVLAFHRLSTRNDEYDRAARALLERVWLAPSGESIVFWSSSGHPRR